MGHYSIKSVYGYFCDSKELNHSSDSSGFWRKIWNLKIPLKAKQFIWRDLTKSLPTKDQLMLKHVAINAMCPVCNLNTETRVTFWLTVS